MEHHYRTFGSRYSNARSQAIDPVRTEPGLLSSSGSASDQQRHNAEQMYQQHLQARGRPPPCCSAPPWAHLSPGSSLLGAGREAAWSAPAGMCDSWLPAAGL